MLDVLRGQITQAWIVGFARGVLESAVMAAIMAGAVYVTSLDFGTAAFVIVPGLWTGIRTLEGVADHIDPTKNRAPAEATSSSPPLRSL